MFNRKTLFPLTVVAAIAALLTFVAVRGWQHAHASPPAAQTNLRKIKVVPVRTSPIEVTEVLWNGAAVAPDSGIPSGGDWVGNLQVRFKNTSDKPISFARILTYDSKPTTGSLVLHYGEEYGTDPTKPTVAPGDYGVARPHIGMYGQTTGTADLYIEASKVVWNFDYDLLWSAGILWALDSAPGALEKKYKEVNPPPTPTPTP
jgi:hypothetical protein